jgi:hypothetical protein
MRVYPRYRAVVMALSAALLVMSAVAEECVPCGIASAGLLQSGGCCNPEGHCKGAHQKVPPGCAKAHSSDVAVVEAADQAAPIPPTVDFCTVASAKPVGRSEPAVVFYPITARLKFTSCTLLF